MAKTGIHIRACNIKSATEHNLRTPDYLRKLDSSGKKSYDIFRDETFRNEHWSNPHYAGKSLSQINDDIRARYQAAVGQKMQEKATPIREGVCPVKPDTKISDFLPFTFWCQSKGISVISIDLHRDEGHINAETGNKEHNYHAHIIFDWTNASTGKSAKLNKVDMCEMQTRLAAALAMERGESRTLTGKEHLSPAQYREQAAAATVKELQMRAENINERLLKSADELKKIEESIPQKRKERAREVAKSAFWDTTAKLANFFGQGAIADAQRETAEARRAATEAANEKSIALRNAKEAITAKETYGSEQYDKGYSKGREDEKETAEKEKKTLREDIKRLKKQMDDNEQNYIANDEKLQKLEKTISDFLKELGKHLPWLDGNLLQNIKTMKEAKMKDDEISAVVRKGRAMVMLPNTSEETEVSLAYMKNEHEKGIQVWFNRLSYPVFLRKIQEKLKALKPAAPKTPTPPKRTPKMGL